VKFKVNDRVAMEVGGDIWTGLVIQTNPNPNPRGDAVRISWDSQEKSGGPLPPRPTTGWLKATSVRHECVIKALGDIVSADGVEVAHE
jgi:hypothetical protein